nr:MAG TPA: hypothetical protein [Caudoviricetes sp.]
MEFQVLKNAYLGHSKRQSYLGFTFGSQGTSSNLFAPAGLCKPV